MVRGENIGRAVIAWAEQEPSVRALVLIGSRVHADGVRAADEFSDWDFQLITDRPALFETAAWMREIGCGEPLAYVVRPGRLGSATKVSMVLQEGEMDLVVLPHSRLRQAKSLLRLGLVSRRASMAQALGGLASVLRGGYRVVKGERAWGDFFRRVATEIPPPRLSDNDARRLAEGFVCDFVSTRRKIARKEFLAAQRWLHHQLAEVNFQLFHELRQRRGAVSLPDARRIERLASEWPEYEVNATPTTESLHAATEKSADTLRGLMKALVGETWRWPDV